MLDTKWFSKSSTRWMWECHSQDRASTIKASIINRRKFPDLNTCVAMQSLLDTWTRLVKSFAAVEVPMMLEDFLLLVDDIPTESENGSPDESPPPAKRQKAFKWQTLHADFKNEHGATIGQKIIQIQRNHYLENLDLIYHMCFSL